MKQDINHLAMQPIPRSGLFPAMVQGLEKQMNTPVTVNIDDLKRIGHTTYGKDGLTRFVCSPETSNVELILLRSILAITGHTILLENDFPWCIEGQPEHHCDIEFVTDYPWDLYRERF